jgi:CheY-like chemotaxis protein
MSEPDSQQDAVVVYDPKGLPVPQATVPIPHKAKCLLAEDNNVNVRLFVRHMNNLNLQNTYQIAWNGQQAVDMYKVNPEQCRMIFMDISMPVMGGMQASLLIREFEKENGLKPAVIVGLVASMIESENRRMIEQFGMDVCLRKPVRFESLRKILEEWPVELKTEDSSV